MLRNPPVLWIIVFCWWTLHGLALAMHLLNMPDAGEHARDLAYALRTGLIGAWLWVPLTMGVIWLTQRYPIGRQHWFGAITVHGITVLGIVVLRAVAVQILNPYIGWYATLPPFSDLLVTSLVNNIAMSWLIVGSAHALLFYQRLQQREKLTVELEARLAQARLQALSAQLNPHFLFNALNSIAELVHHDAQAADRMLVALGVLLRASLDHADAQEVPLSQELALVDRYVDIEKVRLQERLQVERRIDPALLAISVPHLVLQPLVENAVRHAVDRRDTPGRIRISAARVGDKLILTVEDDGGARAQENGSGVGLRNTRARLECLYGQRYEFEIGARAQGGTVVRMALPILGTLAEAA